MRKKYLPLLLAISSIFTAQPIMAEESYGEVVITGQIIRTTCTIKSIDFIGSEEQKVTEDDFYYIGKVSIEVKCIGAAVVVTPVTTLEGAEAVKYYVSGTEQSVSEEEPLEVSGASSKALLVDVFVKSEDGFEITSGWLMEFI